jgi:hypothetical protein
VISRAADQLALQRLDNLLALEACVDRLAAHVADLQFLLRRSRRRAEVVAGTASGLLPHALADRRRALGLSQPAAAAAAGYSRSEVSELERGTRSSAAALGRYAATLERLEHEARWRRTGLAGTARPDARPGGREEEGGRRRRRDSA